MESMENRQHRDPASATDAMVNGVPEFLDGHLQGRTRQFPEIYPGNIQPLRATNRPTGRGGSDVSSRVYDHGAMSRSRFKRGRESTLTMNQKDALRGLESPEQTSPRPYAEDLNQEDLEDERRMKDILEDGKDRHVCDRTKYFLPLGKLDSICQTAKVEKELIREGFSQHDAEKYAQEVCGNPEHERNEVDSRRKIFAILALIDKVKSIKCFIKEGIRDRDLPFIDTEDQSNTPKLERRDPDNRERTVEVSCFKEWRVGSIRAFYATQWEILGPFIGKDENDTVVLYELRNEAIMPWTEYEPMHQDSGYSHVSRVKIHADHHGFQCDSFALKTLHSADWDDFSREFYAFRKVRPEENLLELFAAFRRGSEFSFLFPYAKGGNLKQLWAAEPVAQSPPESPGTRSLVLWIAQQCLGLAAGLSSIHDARRMALTERQQRTNTQSSLSAEELDDFGIHGDIKPENILHFTKSEDGRQRGILKISDFGLTNFHTRGSRSGEGQAGPLSPTYKAPEHDTTVWFKSRKIDIWALGCVFSEFLTWAIWGPAALVEYQSNRLEECDEGRSTAKGSWKEDRFFKKIYSEDGKTDVELKASVVEWIDRLIHDSRSKPHEQNFLTGFLTFIKDKMLHVEREERASVGDLHRFLFEEYQKCQDDESYSSCPSLPTFAPRQEMEVDQPQIQITDEFGNTELSEIAASPAGLTRSFGGLKRKR
ncbi:kinase-like domain-containing protein [Phialemonium atrogriseum]|uniref:Kinase-like domain-containing protein n=1 Tax=Phialemonium atrogriseum TaxID=1093897 RepID=A0AAJ0C4X5_9PEZI|nr:kinase-like domain-containing protein [Phialemonium atrogriseum]KAK1770229.1 kinase-like domain-containing protein [Phialemonium atrogriseum]